MPVMPTPNAHQLRDTAARAIVELSETHRGRDCLAALAVLQSHACALDGSASANLADLLRVVASGEINGSLSEALADYATPAPPQPQAPAALAACRSLADAYKAGAENGGSVDWSDIDSAHALACEALALDPATGDALAAPANPIRILRPVIAP